MNESSDASRRDFFAATLMGGGLFLAYGTLAIQSLLFLLPKRLQPKTRLLFAGRVDQFAVGSVRSFLDLDGNPILIRRGSEGFEAYSSTCPHLGCRVHWESEEGIFFCPCHRGVFDEKGEPVSGPPADAGQRLAHINLKVDDAAGVIYIEVKDPGRRVT
jgi:nitrite reductase/ring-hydroxylating ferredoxin subunit